MEIKEALLESEIKTIKLFLNGNDLLFDELIEKSFYIEENDEVLGTISIYKNIIKCFAVKKEYRSENYGGILISYILNYFYQNNINHFMVYTKLEYANLFLNSNFKEVIRTSNVIILESGSPLITDYVKDIRKKIEYHFDINVDEADIASIVVNCNPVTTGHLDLIEHIAKNHSYVIVFLLEEDLSMFTYKERMSMLYLATSYLSNVLIVPSGEYIISSLTFPNYFLKNEDLKNDEWSKTDALIFNKYFMPILNISKRYVGSETKGYMLRYNNTLKFILEDKLVEVERFKENDIDISASAVRTLIKENKIDEALKYIPNQVKTFFNIIARSKI